MNEEKLNHIEEMLSQLINAVGTIMKEQTAMREDIKEIKADQKSMREDITKIQAEQKSMRDENEVRHHEIMRRFGRLEADQTYTWQKTVENEREINTLKSKAN